METWNQIEGISKKIYRPVALLGAMLFVLATYALLLNKLLEDVGVSALQRLIALVVLESIVVVGWAWNRSSWPKADKKRHTFLLAISTENDNEKARLQNDFVARLRDLIRVQILDKEINLIVLNDFQTEKFKEVLGKRNDSDGLQQKWNALRVKMNIRYVVFGNIRKRNAKGDANYVFELDALIAHPPLMPQLQNQIQADVNAAHIKHLRFPEKMEFEGFQVSAEFVFVVAEFIIGIAAALIGDFKLCAKLQRDVIERAQKIKPFPQNLRSVVTRAENILTDALLVDARKAIGERKFEVASLALREVEPKKGGDYGFLLTKAIELYLIDNNPQAALAVVEKASRLATGDSVWRYSQAFLLCALGDQAGALQVYDLIATSEFPREVEFTVPEIIHFNEQLVKERPNLHFCHFIIGFMRFQKQANYPAALENLAEFLKLSSDNMGPLAFRAQEILLEIDKELGL